MTWRDILIAEFQQIRQRLGGIRGALSLAALAALGTIVPMRAGRSFLDPAYLVAYSCFALIFASSWAAQSFAGASERAFIENRTALSAPDRAVAVGKTLAGALWGWMCWAVILGASLASLSSTLRAVALPPAMTLAGLAVFTLALSFAASVVGAFVALSVESPGTARQLLRMGLLFLLMVAFFGPRLFGIDTLDHLRAFLNWHRVGRNLLIAAPFFVVVGVLLLLRVEGQLAEKREKLSILPD